ncbi:MAG: hypothetical protein RL077_6316 [Verrucomicrobiota bacterium]
MNLNRIAWGPMRLFIPRCSCASRRSEEMFVQYAFRFFLGRNETIRDAKTLQEADRAYEKSGGSMKTLVASLLSSDSFLYRAPEL